MFARVHVDGVAVANSEARQTQGLVTLETGITTHALLDLTAGQAVDVRVHFATRLCRGKYLRVLGRADRKPAREAGLDSD